MASKRSEHGEPLRKKVKLWYSKKGLEEPCAVDAGPKTNLEHDIPGMIMNRIGHRLRRRDELLDEYKITKSKRQSMHKSNRISSWSRGKLYYIEGNQIHLVASNYATLNYLNLEEYAIPFMGEPPPPENDQFRRHLRSNLNRHPIIEDTEHYVLRHYFGDYQGKFFQDFPFTTYIYFSFMKHERFVVGLLSLLKQWDAARYINLLQKSIAEPALVTWNPYIDIYKMFVQVVIACCEDSSFIVEVFEKLYCSRTSGLRTYASDDKYHIIFFMCHLQRTNFKNSLFLECTPSLDVLSWAICNGNVECLKLGLELEFSLGYPNSIWLMFAAVERRARSNIFRTESTFWPRQKDQVRSESYNSVEFYAAFTYITLFTSTRYFDSFNQDRRRNILECFKLLWRAVPTPYLPLEDMQKCVDKIRPRRLNIFQVFDDNSVRSEILPELFADDFPTEFKPRSLKHLSRCAVRRQFRTPEQISSLPIPKRMKQYLLLEY